MPRVPHLDRAGFVAIFGDAELAKMAGTGGYNTPDGPGLDEDRIAKAIAYADNRVEGYLHGRYPPGTTHTILTQAAADIARYRLRSDTNAATISQEVRDRYNDALSLLRDVQAGRQALTDTAGLALGVADGPAGTVMTSIDSGFAPLERVPQALRGWLT